MPGRRCLCTLDRSVHVLFLRPQKHFSSWSFIPVCDDEFYCFMLLHVRTLVFLEYAKKTHTSTQRTCKATYRLWCRCSSAVGPRNGIRVGYSEAPNSSKEIASFMNDNDCLFKSSWWCGEPGLEELWIFFLLSI